VGSADLHIQGRKKAGTGLVDSRFSAKENPMVRVERRTPKGSTGTKKVDQELDKESDANDLNDTAPYGHASIQTTRADFDRNKDGLYGGLPKAREPDAPGEVPTRPTPTPGKS
jgi:hypothetical protein